MKATFLLPALCHKSNFGGMDVSVSGLDLYLGFRFIWGSGFCIYGLGFRVQALSSGFMFTICGFRFSGFGAGLALSV